MHIRKLFITSLAITAIAMIAALTFPCIVDAASIGEAGSEECTSLLARQKPLAADDQKTRLLAMQCMVKLWQAEVDELKLQQALLSASPSTATPSARVPPSSAPVPLSVAPVPSSAVPVLSATPQISSTTGTTTGTQEKRPKPAVAVKQPVVEPIAVKQPVVEQSDLPDGLLAALGLVLVILALWLGLRYYAKSKSRIGIKSQQDDKSILKVADDVAAAPKMVIVVKPSPTVPSSPVKREHAPVVVAPPKASVTRSEVAPLSPPMSQKIEEEVTEDDSMLEEAGLYATHGRPAKAIEILQEIIKRRPEKANAWPLLLSIYSSLGKASEFEKTAREFLKHHPGSPSWSGIQALGRTFDKDNPLYADSHISAFPVSSDAANPRRPIGDILMEMGILSKQDLQEYLDDFDPKKHGRFGGYLVARKVITLAQLDQALLQQQGVDTEVKPGSMPSLQEMENLLADFDPKRDGSVGEFLASRKVTPEKLGQLLQQQSNHGAAAQTPQADD
jgi:tetratricopeptide (TPR) repeat protein